MHAIIIQFNQISAKTNLYFRPLDEHSICCGWISLDHGSCLHRLRSRSMRKSKGKWRGKWKGSKSSDEAVWELILDIYGFVERNKSFKPKGNLKKMIQQSSWTSEERTWYLVSKLKKNVHGHSMQSEIL